MLMGIGKRLPAKETSYSKRTVLLQDILFLQDLTTMRPQAGEGRQ